MTAVHLRNLSAARCLGLLPLALVAIPLGCGSAADESLCTTFAEFLDARASVLAVDPSRETAAVATDLAEDYLTGVRRLKHAADGRYGQQLDTLEAAVNDALLTLASVRDDGSYEVWGPLIQDDLDRAADAAVTIEDSIDPSCRPSESSQLHPEQEST